MTFRQKNLFVVAGAALLLSTTAVNASPFNPMSATVDAAADAQPLILAQQGYPSMQKGGSGDPSMRAPGGDVKMKSEAGGVEPTEEKKYPPVQKGSSGGPNFKAPDGEVKMESSAGSSSGTAPGKYPALKKDSGGDPSFKTPSE